MSWQWQAPSSRTREGKVVWESLSERWPSQAKLSQWSRWLNPLPSACVSSLSALVFYKHKSWHQLQLRLQFQFQQPDLVCSRFDLPCRTDSSSWHFKLQTMWGSAASRCRRRIWISYPRHGERNAHKRKLLFAVVSGQCDVLGGKCLKLFSNSELNATYAIHIVSG